MPSGFSRRIMQRWVRRMHLPLSITAISTTTSRQSGPPSPEYLGPKNPLLHSASRVEHPRCVTSGEQSNDVILRNLVKMKRTEGGVIGRFMGTRLKNHVS